MARIFSHVTAGQLRLCIVIIALLFMWHTAKYLSPNLSSVTSKSTITVDGIEYPQLLPVRVEVYYETLCPDSRSFILYQLKPTFQKLYHFIDILFVPYGKARTVWQIGLPTFQCQHGPEECLANKVHACALNIIKDQNITMDLISCMIDDNSKPKEIGQLCAKKFSSPWEDIWNCATSESGTYLLEKAGKKTAKLQNISFIPTIRLQMREERQKEILKDLHGEICKLIVKIIKGWRLEDMLPIPPKSLFLKYYPRHFEPSPAKIV